MKRLLDRQVSLLHYLTSGDAIFRERAEVPLDEALVGVYRGLLRIEARFSHEKRMEKILGRTPMNRFGEPEDIGWAAVYLCSPAAKFVTGICLPVDGGASIGF